ncbi:hypothetical protein [Streptomyces sp. NPDC093261]|uniref:hypothetical protein n=1 Tax=Streptomyces sp. NPDC093261 TaxID=3366037 RepID=UPI0037FEB2F9
MEIVLRDGAKLRMEAAQHASEHGWSRHRPAQMVMPMRPAATILGRLDGAGGALAGDDIGTTSWHSAGTLACRHTVGTRRSEAYLVGHHSFGRRSACSHHVTPQWLLSGGTLRSFTMRPTSGPTAAGAAAG